MSHTHTYHLHIANKNYSSWSLRPWVLMQALEIPFVEHMHPFLDSTQDNSNHQNFHTFSPTGKVPCLHVHVNHAGHTGHNKPLVVWDSLAIAEYLAEHHAGVWPAEPTARAWARSAAAEMHSGFNALRQICSMNCGLRIEVHPSQYQENTQLRRDVQRLSALWEEGLQRFGAHLENPQDAYLAGAHFTAVDAFFAPVAYRIQTYQMEQWGILSESALAYASRLRALPAMQKWYAAALAETWRDLSHEPAKDTHTEQTLYKVLADLRA